MSRKLLAEKGIVIAEHSTDLDFPITYVLHHPTLDEKNEFKISIYHERFLNGNRLTRDGNSDIPFATWLPKRGLVQVNFAPFVTLRDAGLLEEVEQFCERAYDAWKNS